MASQTGPRGDSHLCILQEPTKQVPISVDSNIKAQWKIVGSEMINMLRLKQLSLQMIYTHVAAKNKMGIKSPLDQSGTQRWIDTLTYWIHKQPGNGWVPADFWSIYMCMALLSWAGFSDTENMEYSEYTARWRFHSAICRPFWSQPSNMDKLIHCGTILHDRSPYSQAAVKNVWAFWVSSIANNHKGY